MIKKYLVFEVEVRTDGEKHEVGVKDVTEKVVVMEKQCSNCKWYIADRCDSFIYNQECHYEEKGGDQV